MNYTEIKHPLKIENKVVKFNDKDITIYSYLPIKDKNDIVYIALQKAEDNGLYNEFALEAFFYLNIIYSYTDIDFSPEDRSDEFALYDEIKESGLLDLVLSEMDREEYASLKDNLDFTKEAKVKFNSSAAGVLRTFITDLPKNVEAAEEIVNSFDKEKFAEVVNFAKAANGGRPIEG